MHVIGLYLPVRLEQGTHAVAVPLLRKPGVQSIFLPLTLPDPTRRIDQLGFRELLQFGRDGELVVKISAPFRSSLQGSPYTDVVPYVAACIEAYTLERCVWGSDWPFVRMDQLMDYGPPSACLARWLP